MRNVAVLAFALAGCQLAAQHPNARFPGRIAGAAIAELKDEGYACWLEHRRSVPELERAAGRGPFMRPVLFCSRWDPSPGAACIEKRYAFEVDWSDRDAANEQVVEQLRKRPVAYERYVCVPNG